MTRSEFCDLIWSKPISRLAKDLGVSDSWLIKLCRTYNIPRPPRHYWNKKHAGKAVVSRPELPGQADDVVLLRESQRSDYGGLAAARAAQARARRTQGVDSTVPEDGQAPPPSSPARSLPGSDADMPAVEPVHKSPDGSPSAAIRSVGAPLRSGTAPLAEFERWQRRQDLVLFLEHLLVASAFLPDGERRKVEEWASRAFGAFRASDPLDALVARILGR